MKVSVITITYCDDAGLEKTTRSVLSQRGDFETEHIVVDGGARVSTKEILARLGSTATLVSEPDRGRYDAMNKGIRLATGDVLWFMHSGDRFGSEGSIAAALAATESPTREWGYGFARLVDSAETMIGISGRPVFSMKWLAFGVVVPHQAAFFGSEVVSELGPYDEEIGLAADQLYMLRAAQIRPPTQVYDFLCDFDISGAGTIRAPHRHLLDFRKIRRQTGTTMTGSHAFDTALTILSAGVLDVHHFLPRLLKRVG